MDFAYYNGSFLPYRELRVPLSDRAIYFGDGVYECLIGGGGSVYQWQEHMARLRFGAEFMRLSITDCEGLYSAATRLIELSGYERYVIYVQLSRASEHRAHAVRDFSRTNLLMTVTELEDFDCREISLITREDIRYRMCHVKTLNLIPSVLASHDAIMTGADEAVFIRGGTVTECAHSNVFILEGGTLITHPKDEYILPGITRETLIRIAEKHGIPTVECGFGKERLITADEVIITSTTKLARRASSIDGTPLKMNDPKTFRMLFTALESDFIENCC